MTVYMKVAIFWDLMLHILVDMYECYEEPSASMFRVEEGRWRYSVPLMCQYLVSHAVIIRPVYDEMVMALVVLCFRKCRQLYVVQSHVESSAATSV
jgi:hypothetical protein